MDIVWHRADVGVDAALRAHLGAVDVGRLCPSCGSGTHGRPWVRLSDGSSPHVSLSRCGAHLVTVVADHPVGIDVELIAAVDGRWDPALVLHPGEPDPHPPHVPRDVPVFGYVPRDVPVLAHDPRDVPVFGYVPRDVREGREGRGVPVTVARQRAAIWTRKEAILKALGTGLRTPMSEICCGDWPVRDIPAPPGLVAAVVVLAQTGSGGSSTE